MDRKIDIVIDRSGKVKFETKGIPGEACIEQSDWIDAIFGHENIHSDEKTSEFYEQEIAVTTQTVRGK